MKRLLPFLFLVAAVAAWAQVTSDFSLVIHPTLDIPLAPKLSDGTPYYTIGGGLSLKGEYVLPFAPMLYTGLALDADIAPINSAGKALTLLALGPELGVRFSPISRLNLKLAGYGGLYFGIVDAGTVRNPFFAGLADASYLLTPALSLGLGATYKHYLEPDGPVYQGIGVNLGIQYHIGAGSGKADLKVVPTLQPIFPLFYSYYDKNPAGTLTIENQGRAPLENLKVSFFVKQYMDQPKECATLPRLAAGEQADVPVYALFTKQIVSVTEGDKAAGEIQVRYSYLGKEMTGSYPVTVTIHHRNAMTWDDDRKAAAFVTAKDPLIQSFAKRIAAGVDTKSNASFNGKFRTAMGLFEALGPKGANIGYVTDSSTPYAKLSAQDTAIDSLQFPGETLAYQGGDCDDISILYSALVEAAAIEAAFITAPGHIFMAFNTEMDAETARKTFVKPEELILRDDGAWVPVEITLVRDGFLKAWQIGAKEWREASAAGQAGFYPIREAWNTYEPVGFGEIKQAVMLPGANQILDQYEGELRRFITAQVDGRVSSLQAELRKSPGNSRLLNSLGVLYARFGELDKAAAQFQQILKSGEVASALINLGNISYLKDDMGAALTYYNRALRKAPDNSAALLGVARASYEMEDYKTVETVLAQLKGSDPTAASKFSYLGGGGGTARASEAGKREVDEWSE